MSSGRGVANAKTFCLKACVASGMSDQRLKRVLKLDLQFHLYYLGKLVVSTEWGSTHTARNSLNVLEIFSGCVVPLRGDVGWSVQSSVFSVYVTYLCGVISRKSVQTLSSHPTRAKEMDC